ncbi:DoxX family protein [Streptomyces sp. Je 1-4]|uniref:DoxX family protein n=1 Tax=Streptomyces TaxID=1883 RepID=UPI0021D86370|nr:MULTISPECIES: DoxX family protein [unclassified Streptomyces]UYB42675.1 DoxX family protein [Streptomyces sp. Je 1-4]UZQ38998.1 DoxX family protein [Streptomyces sp. Je 1-4] [Streptomyces sp. Je 1-4 4N24]UZQ46415.1 DoxX family protein [Streptomyces sp. Je 1-4] [Streptomyces sp. Je 1-4 4N24_ara]
MSPLTSFLQRSTPHALALFRIVIGLLFACHGASSLFGVLGGAMGQGGTVPTGSWPGWYAAVIQLAGGLLVMLGLGTRAAAFISSGSMAYAYFSAHQGSALWPIQNGGEASAMYCWAFLLLLFTGPGSWALDRVFFGDRDQEAAPSAQREPSAA